MKSTTAPVGLKRVLIVYRTGMGGDDLKRKRILAVECIVAMTPALRTAINIEIQ